MRPIEWELTARAGTEVTASARGHPEAAVLVRGSRARGGEQLEPRTRPLMALILCIAVAGCGSPSGSTDGADPGHIRSPSSAHVRPLFDAGIQIEIGAGPFPTDLLTVEDPAQNTGRRIALPVPPDCIASASDCADVAELNLLDGFGLQTRLSIPFDGPIDPSTVSSETVFVVDLGGTLPGDPPATGARVGINQRVWDPETHTLHVEVDEQLRQHRRYGLIVTEGVLAGDGSHLKTNGDFRDFLESGEPAWYRERLAAAVRAARALGVDVSAIAVASAFTTQTITSVLERMADAVRRGPPPAASFDVALDGSRAVFSLSSVTKVDLLPQTNTGQTVTTLPIDPVATTDYNRQLTQVAPGAVGTIAFGSFQSPNHVVIPAGFTPVVGTLAGTPPVLNQATIYFDLILPAGPRPPGGWPIAIVGHGGSGQRSVTASAFAGSMAAQGIATIAINAFGYGRGPNGRLDVHLSDGTTRQVRSGGRSFDANADGTIAANEGSFARGPKQWVVGERDTSRQTAIDLVQLVRVIEAGLDVDGDGSADVDRSRIFYYGNSNGSMYGTLFLAIEPRIQKAVLAVSGGLSPEHGRFAPARRGGLGNQLFSRTPRLIGPTSANGAASATWLREISGVAVVSTRCQPPVCSVTTPIWYDENKPLRDLPIVVNDVPGAIQIQEAFERHEWGQQSGQSPLPWLPHLGSSPLPGNEPKSLILQFNDMDQNSPQPTAAAIVRTGDLAGRTMWYRHDLAYATDPTMPKNPHAVPVSPADDNETFAAVSRELQRIGATFFATEGEEIAQPQPAQPAQAHWFEVPVQGSLPETISFIPDDP